MYSSTILYNFGSKKIETDKRNGKHVISETVNNSFTTSIVRIIKCISETKTNDARALLRKAISEDMENAEIYNLLGISYEVDGNRLKASKFYRVSYYMDQTFKAASDNLERVCQFNYRSDKNTICWGVDFTEVKK